MSSINEKAIRDCVGRLSQEANFCLRRDVRQALKKAVSAEHNVRARKILSELLDNARIAKRDSLALCQDTGMPVVFLEIGPDVNLSGVNVARSIHMGLAAGYKKGYLRNSIVSDPLLRGRLGFSPGIIHTVFSTRKGLRITVFPKGFGCENKTRLKMFVPTASVEDIEKFIVGCVRDAGADACPPYVVGIGIGGTSDYACQLSKEALLRPLNQRNPRPHVALLEKRLMKTMNALNIGPMGLGGKTSVLGVNILTYPTHMAGLPVCVNISCHVLRSASERL